MATGSERDFVRPQGDGWVCCRLALVRVLNGSSIYTRDCAGFMRSGTIESVYFEWSPIYIR